MQTDVRQEVHQALIFVLPALGVLLLDQVSKIWVLAALRPDAYGVVRIVEVVDGFLRFAYAENRGAAFSLFQNHPGALSVVALGLAFGVVVAAFLLVPPSERLSRLALGLIFGGAVGNLIDRFRYGFVVDFIEVYAGDLYVPPIIPWPRFNIADSAICIGIGFFFIASILAPPKEVALESTPAKEATEAK